MEGLEHPEEEVLVNRIMKENKSISKIKHSEMREVAVQTSLLPHPPSERTDPLATAEPCLNAECREGCQGANCYTANSKSIKSNTMSNFTLTNQLHEEEKMVI